VVVTLARVTFVLSDACGRVSVLKGWVDG